MDELHEFTIDKANEIEITVYDRSGDHLLPIGMLWVRISDIAEEMRRKKIESELQNSGWVSADMMGGNAGGIQPDLQFQPPPGANSLGPGGPPPGAAMRQQGGPQPQTGPVMIDDWFSLEPVGRIHLTMSFGEFISHSGLSPRLTHMKPSTRAARRPSTSDWAEKAPSASAKKKWLNSMATSSCNNSFTTSCAAHFVASSSSTLLECSAQTATIPATRSAIQRWSPNVLPNPTPKPIRTRQSSTTASLIDSKTFPTWGPTGAVTVVISFRLVASRRRNAQVCGLLVSYCVLLICVRVWSLLPCPLRSLCSRLLWNVYGSSQSNFDGD